MNQNKTGRQERAGGYLWSPKKKSDGSRNPYYDFMTEVQPGDIIFSFVARQIGAIGVATSDAFSSNKPADFGAAGQVWSQDGWRVNVEFKLLDKPLEPRNHMHLIRPLLPAKYSPLKQNGDGQELYLTSIPLELGMLLMDLLGEKDLTWPVVDLSEIQFNPEEQELILDASIEETMRATLVLARRGQGAFRERVRFFEKECRVTGVSESELLIASHIKPWKVSNNEERVSGHNGLFLSPHIDKLFDKGFITFEDNGQLWRSNQLDPEVLERWAIDETKRVGKFNSEQAYFLGYHRENVFRAA